MESKIVDKWLHCGMFWFCHTSAKEEHYEYLKMKVSDVYTFYKQSEHFIG